MPQLESLAKSVTNNLVLLSLLIATLGAQSPGPIIGGGVLTYPAAAAGGTDCTSCTYVQSTHSSQSAVHDWPTLNNVTAGDTLVYFGEFSQWASGATVSMTDSHGQQWYRCDTGATTAFPEVQDQTTNGMSCHFTPNTAAWVTLTAQPVASQCTGGCTLVGGTYLEINVPDAATNGPLILDAWGTPHGGSTVGTGANNVSCGSITLVTAHDFIMCDFNNASGTPTAGTTPVAFTMRETIVTAIETGISASSGTITTTGKIGTSGVAYTAIQVAFK